MRVWYRIRQFWLALSARPTPQDLALAGELLSPAQMTAFQRMQPSEQAHSLWVCRQVRQRLEDQNAQPFVTPEQQRDVLVAALLHDVGKSRHPLRLWERVLVVLGKALFPQQVKRWGSRSLEGLQRAFVIAEQHPAWGAEIAAQAGASPLAVALVRRHQEQLAKSAPGASALEDRLLLQLQYYDDER